MNMEIEGLPISELVKVLDKPWQPGRVWDMALTLNLNRWVDLNTVKTVVRSYDRHLNRRLLGRRYYSKPFSERILLVMVPEVGSACGYMHLHGMVSFPMPDLLCQGYLLESSWEKLEYRGSICIRDLYLRNGWLHYMLTNYNDHGRGKTRFAEEFIMSEMLH